MSDLYPNSYQIPAMLINKQPDQEILKRRLESGEYIGTVKKDGYWYELEKTPEGEVYLFSRSKSRKTGELTEKSDNVPHIKAWGEKYLKPGTVLIGEIYYPGKTSKDVTKIMGSLPQKAVRRQFDTDDFGGPIHYYVHDVIYNNKANLMDFPYEEREKRVWDFHYNDFIYPHDRCLKNLYDNLLYALDQGEEGMVFKKKDGIYQPGKRPTYNFKVKTEDTLDAIIIGFVEPEREYKGQDETWPYYEGDTLVTKAYYNGWKAGVEIGLFDGGKIVPIGTISSGMTDYLRQDMAENPNEYLNKVIEIQAMSVDADARSIRHGRLVSIRDDKNIEDCTIESVFA